MSKFVLILGPTGVGKSSVIDELIKIDKRFVYISPYTNRPLRKGEINKIHVDEKKLDEMNREKLFLIVNELYGFLYATPYKPIKDAISQDKYPILDWPIDKLNLIKERFNNLYVIYLAPPSLEILVKRLSFDERSKNSLRFDQAEKETIEFFSGKYNDLFDLSILSEDNKTFDIAKKISNHLK